MADPSEGSFLVFVDEQIPAQLRNKAHMEVVTTVILLVVEASALQLGLLAKHAFHARHFAEQLTARSALRAAFGACQY